MKRSKTLLIASIIATICLIYVVSYMSSTASQVDGMESAEATGTSIAIMLAMPFAALSGIGTLMAWIGWLTRVRGFALAAGILFSVAMVMMIPWFYFVIVQMILCYVAFARMGKKKEA